MTEEEIKKIVQLREFTINYYKTLDGAGVSTSVVKQDDVAYILETVVKSIDDIIKPHVRFTGKV